MPRLAGARSRPGLQGPDAQPLPGKLISRRKSESGRKRLEQKKKRNSLSFRRPSLAPSLPPSLNFLFPSPLSKSAQEFQRFKSHPKIRELLEGGTCRSYGARTLNEGGWQSLPRLDFPGGALLGCAAGTLVVPRIKGVHTAIASGIQAAEVVFDALQKDDGLAREAEERRRQKAAAPAEKGEVGREEELFSGDEEEAGEGDEDLSKPYVRPSLDLSDYDRVLRESWVGRELEEARNIRPG